MNYKLTTTYSSKDDLAPNGKHQHVIVESWDNLSKDEFSKQLIETLDVFLDEEHKPAIPAKEYLKNKISKFTDDEKFIEKEFARFNVSYKVYSDIMNAVGTSVVNFKYIKNVPEMNNSIEVEGKEDVE